MLGYCEICQKEQHSVEDEDSPICPKCGHDLVYGVHIDDEFYNMEVEEDTFGELWPYVEE